MKLPGKKKNDEPQLELATAQQMLDNVFDACKLEHNTVPLEILSSYSNYRKERYALQKTILILMMMLFVFLPLLFIPAKIDITQDTDNQTLLADITTLLPIRRINAVINGKNVPIYEVSANHYVVQPSANGTLTLSVTLVNRQETTIEYEVGMVDNSAPKVLASELKDHTLVLYLEDADSGINYEGIYLTTGVGVMSEPLSYDPETGCVVVEYPTEITNVYVPDNTGNTLHLLLTPQ